MISDLRIGGYPMKLMRWLLILSLVFFVLDGARAGVSEKLYSDIFSGVNDKVQKLCNVGYLTWPMTLTSK